LLFEEPIVRLAPFLFDESRWIALKRRVRKTRGTPLKVFVLAGGRNSRMGRDKARLLLGSKSFLQRIIESARDLDVPVEVVTKDDVPGRGPLGGVATALRTNPPERALFLSCDMPLITSDMLKALLTAGPEAVFTEVSGLAGFPFAVPRSALAAASQTDSVQDLARRLNSAFFTPKLADQWQFLNVNTPADYRHLLQVWRDRHQSDAVLELRHLTVRRGGNPMVSDLSWKVGRGEHWAVLGPNGCGKTSLFSALLGYVTPTKGEIFVLGDEYGDADWPALRQKIGLVSSSLRQMMADSEPAWITVASGKYAMIDFWGTPKKRERADALELLERSECLHIADRPWAVLSQGERQRVLIVRALMARPALLILDEPCAGLDPAARERFLHFLEHLGRSAGSPSIVLVTHHVEEVMPIFTHALLMKGGRKLAAGSIDSMLTSRLLSEAFDIPIRVRRQSGRFALSVSARGNLIA
jgi:iron complex transport system ATP-binding protein